MPTTAQEGDDEADVEEETFSEEEEGGEGGGSPGGPSGSEATFVTLGAPNTAGAAANRAY